MAQTNRSFGHLRIVEDFEDSVPPPIIWFDEEDPEPNDDYGIYEGEEDGRMEVSTLKIG